MCERADLAAINKLFDNAMILGVAAVMADRCLEIWSSAFSLLLPLGKRLGEVLAIGCASCRLVGRMGWKSRCSRLN
jgi:hypothetical protein